ncbi:hypothetical protein [Algibacter sp. R77976]|uniref:hypothetical protein n=1 Tax=Algibacter sp. R77976 TaxID=3093873 RepID=UPI0037C5AC59
MKKILFVFCLLFSTTIIAQNMRDVVHLKNGSIIKGTITEMNPSKNLKIKTADGSLFVYAMSDVLKMEKEEFVGNEVNQETSTSVSQSALDNFFSDYLTQKRPALEFVGVSKKNGIKKDVFGQKIYEIEYELIFETKENIYINASQFGSAWSNKFVDDFSYSLKGSDGYEAALAGAKKLIEKGNRIVSNGTLNFEQTDNGWRATSFRNKNFKTVSSNYISPQMAEQKKRDNANKLASYISQGDWKNADIPEEELSTLYYQADNVPIFESSTTKFSTKKHLTCNDCRNDNIRAIDAGIKKSIQSMNRYNISNDTEHSSSPNASNIIFYITDINFKHLGVKENGDNKGFSCVINYSIAIDAIFNSPQNIEITDQRANKASSNLFKTYYDKKSAFYAAVSKLNENIYSFMMKYEPYALEVIRIKSNDKGKIEAVILKKPNLFPNIRRGEFLIYQKGALSVKKNKYSLSSSVGKCKFKGEINGDEISCEISGGKNRKAFAKIKTPADFTAMSSF